MGSNMQQKQKFSEIGIECNIRTGSMSMLPEEKAIESDTSKNKR